MMPYYDKYVWSIGVRDSESTFANWLFYGMIS
jgi:hypothetical protein